MRRNSLTPSAFQWDEAELAPLEEHLLVCRTCIERAELAAEYVDLLRAAIIGENFDPV